MKLVIASLTFLYSKLLFLYPRGFKGEFYEEMQVVFRDLLNEALCEGTLSFLYVCLKEFGGLPFHVLRELWHEIERKESGMVNDNSITEPNSNMGMNRRDAFLGTLPFLLFGIASMIGKLRLPFWGIYADLAFYVIVLLGLLIGMIKEVPRWTYGYLGWSLVFAWWWSNMGTYGLKILGFQINHWSWQIWPPLLVSIFITLVWTRSLRPLQQLVRGIWQDWTLASFMMYTLVAFAVLLYDENHHPYLIAFMIGSTLVTSAAAWFFMREHQTQKRIIALPAGFVAAAIIGTINEVTWDWRAYYGLPPQPPVEWYVSALRIFIITIVCCALLFWPALVGLARRAFNNRRTM